MALVTIMAPNGETRDVDEREAEAYVRDGARIVQPQAQVASRDQTRSAGLGGLIPRNFNREQARSASRMVMNAIPPVASGLSAVAALPSAVVAGPAGPMMAAGLGWMGGEGLRQAISTASGYEEPAPFSPEALGRIGAGFNQGVYSEAGGQLLSGASQASARGLMRSAFRPSKTIQKQAGRNMTSTARAMYPEGERIWETALRERLPADPNAIASAGRQEAANRSALFAGSGERFTANDAVGPAISELRARLAKDQSPAPLLAQLDEELRAFQAAHGAKRGPLGKMLPAPKYTPEQFRSLLDAWQENARTLYKSEGAGPIKKEVAKALARDARAAMERIPGVGQSNARLQRLGLLGEAAKDANMRGGAVLIPAGAAAGTALYGYGDPVQRLAQAAAAYGLTRAAASPGVQSRMALMLSDPRFLGYGASQLPRALMYAYGNYTDEQLP